jgi:hypothetical protein
MAEILLVDAEQLTKHLTALRNARRERQVRSRQAPTPRKRLSSLQREDILLKTDGRCHICGGAITSASWHADHVLSHSDGGTHSIDNYLAAHAVCNNYRWDYSPEEFQWIMKIGVWARLQMENGSVLGAAIARQFHKHERRNKGRRKKMIQSR